MNGERYPGETQAEKDAFDAWVSSWTTTERVTFSLWRKARTLVRLVRKGLAR